MARRTNQIFQWLVRSGVLIVCLIAISRPQPDPQTSSSNSQFLKLGPPQSVQTTDKRVCVHTRLTDEVEEVKIQRTLELVREMGATTIVEFLPWAYIEAEEGKYDWYHPDRIIRHAENQGLLVLARLGFVPEWARADIDTPTSLNYLPVDHYPDFARFVGEFASRYAGRVDHLIIWNEPNLNFEWGGHPADPVAYTELLRQAYEAAHAVNPDVVILNGALAPTLAPPGGQEGGWDDLDYLRRMYEAGAAEYFDAMAIHTYGFGLPPQAAPGEDVLNFRRIELLRDIMISYGDTEKPVYVTETGWNDHPRWVFGVRPVERIDYTLEMYQFTQAAYPWLDSICLWVFRYPAPVNSYPDYYTLVSPNFDLKPIYKAMQDYARGAYRG